MRRRPGSGDDAAKTLVLEAVIAASIMVSAAAFAATLERPPSASNANGERFQQVLDDMIDIMLDTPLPPDTPCNGPNVFAQAVDEAIGGDLDIFSGSFEKSFGPGFRENAYIDHSDARYPFITEFDNPSPATRMVPYRPNYTWSKIILASDTLSGQESMTIDVPALKRHTLVRPHGEAIVTTLKVEGNLVTNNVTLASLTAMPGPIDDEWKRSFAQSIAWATLAGAPTLARELTAEQLTTPQPFFLRIEPGLSGANLDETVLPAELRLNITLPRGWDVDETALADANSVWTVVVTGSEDSGWQIQMALNAGIASALLVRVDAQPPPSPTSPFDEFYAKLGHGSLGESTLLIGYPASADRGLPRVAYATTPYPVRHGTEAVFGLAFANGGDDVTVTQLDVEIPGGYDVSDPDLDGQGVSLFASSPVSKDANGGTWTRLDGKHLRWTGSKNVDAASVAYWAYAITFTSDLSQQTKTQPKYDDGPKSILKFDNGYVHETRRWGSTPAVFRHIVPPETTLGSGDDGYPWSATGASHTIVGEVVTPKFKIHTTGAYETGAVSGDAVSMQNGVANSTFDIDKRLAPLGSLVKAEADVSSLASFASTTGATSTTFTAELYSPNTYGCEPIMTWSREIQTLPLSAIRAIEVWDSTGGVTGSPYLTGDDSHLYKVDQAGTILWSKDLQSPGLVLARGDFGLLDKGIFVGVKAGMLKRFDPATGTLAWTAILPRAAWSTSKTPNSITSIDVDEDAGRVLVASSAGIVQLRSSSGSLLGEYETLTVGESYAQVGFAPNGRMFGLTLDGHLDEFTLFEDSLDATRTRHNGFHFALGTVGIILHVGLSTFVLPYETLGDEALPSFTHGPIILATAGDATGDDIDDHIHALADLTLIVIDGATGEIAWTFAPNILPPGATPPTELEPFLPPGEEDVCSGVTGGSQYTSPVTCDSLLGAATGTPLALDARDGRVAYARKESEKHRLSVITEGEAVWTKELTSESKPLVVAMGAWGVNGAVATGTDGGLLTVHDRAVGVKLLETEPTEFAGKFSFHFRVPPAGLYGTHILKGTLSWEGATGETYAGSVMDTFEVVGANGVPNTSPRYRVHFLIEDSSDPYIMGRGS